MLGLANTHDTKARVPGQLLKANQEGLQRYTNKEIGRVRKDWTPPETSHPVADQISMVLKEELAWDMSFSRDTSSVSIHSFVLILDAPTKRIEVTEKRTLKSPKKDSQVTFEPKQSGGAT